MTRRWEAMTGLVVLWGAMAAGTGNSLKQADGSAKGWLKVNGKEIVLNHAYAVADAPELAMPSMGKEGFDLFLTDSPLSEAELECRSLIMLRVRKGALHGIVLSFNPAKKRPHNGQLWYEKQSMFYSILGDSEDHKFESRKLTGEAIAGKVWMPKEYESDVAGPEPVKFQYEVTLQAKVRRPGPITATLAGKAAQDSPQAKALRAFCKAVRAGNITGLQASGVKAQMAVLAGPEAKDMLEAMQQGMPDPSKLVVSKVMVRGNMAVLQAKGPMGSVAMKCLKENGVWKMGLN